MSEKVITKAIAEEFLQDCENVDLDKFTSIENQAAEILAKHEGDLHLGGLTFLTNQATEALAKHKGVLTLSSERPYLTDKAAEALAKYKRDNLSLNGLTTLTDQAAKHQGRFVPRHPDYHPYRS